MIIIYEYLSAATASLPCPGAFCGGARYCCNDRLFSSIPIPLLAGRRRWISLPIAGSADGISRRKKHSSSSMPTKVSPCQPQL